MKQAFNDAAMGREVVIHRWGQKFRLTALVDEPSPVYEFEPRHGEIPPIVKREDTPTDDPIYEPMEPLA